MAMTKTFEMTHIGCWFKYDMYSHNCSNLLNAIRRRGVDVEVVTANCRCFSSRERFAITETELVDARCKTIRIPCAPRTPFNKSNMLKYLLVKYLRLDLPLDVIRGIGYYLSTRHAETVHYDQVLEAFGCFPLFVMALIPGARRKKLLVTVHEIDPFQVAHRWINRVYRKCQCIFVFSENMKRELGQLGISAERIRVIRYGALIPKLSETERSGYIYFGGHHILKGKGYKEVLGALQILKARGFNLRLFAYYGYGCAGLAEAKEMAAREGVAGMIDWRDFMSGAELDVAYQASKACIVPFTGGSARHPVSAAMANATPVIATRMIDIPEYLGDLGVYIDGSAESIAAAVEKIENSAAETANLGRALRNKAACELDFDGVAQEVVREVQYGTDTKTT